MVVFAYSFYGNQNLWVKYYRRGLSLEIETDGASSPRLYGMMLRSVASRECGPGSRWTYFLDSSRHWNARASANSSMMGASMRRTHIYEWSHLSYGGASPFDNIYDIDDEDNIYDWYGPEDHEFKRTPVPAQCVYQDRCALRGTHRGTRSSDALVRRFTNWKPKQLSSRRDFSA